jgi:flagellar assembly factor FliW
MTAQPDVSGLLGTESQPIHFPAGLVGFDEWKNFVLVAHAAGGPLRLMQSLDDERVSFIVVDPRHIVPDYRPRLSPEDNDMLSYAAGFEIAWQGEVGIYCILSMHEESLSITANLLSPLVVNWQAGIGRQVILSNSGYEARFLVAKAVPQA